MPKVTLIRHDGVVHEVDAACGRSLMQTAVANNVAGIDADCGGACACATCHVYVDEAWIARVGSRSDMEASMLDFADGVRETSRLACQITIDDALDGLVVRLPAAQHEQEAPMPPSPTATGDLAALSSGACPCA